MKPMYAVYKGDECLGVGTADELAEKLGVSRDTVKWWASPSAQKRALTGEHKRPVRFAERIRTTW